MNQMVDYAWRVKREIIYTLIDGIPYNSVLDIGCARGEQLKSYVKEGAKGYGLDIMDLRIIKNDKINNIQFIRGDALNLPFKDEVFDLVTAIEIIEHLPDHNQFLSDVHRILRQNGFLALSTPNQLRFTAFLGRVRGKKGKRYMHSQNGKYSHISGVGGKQYGHVSEVTPMKLKKELRNSGFEVETLKYGAFNPSIFPFSMGGYGAYKLIDKMTNSK